MNIGHAPILFTPRYSKPEPLNNPDEDLVVFCDVSHWLPGNINILTAQVEILMADQM